MVNQRAMHARKIFAQVIERVRREPSWHNSQANKNGVEQTTYIWSTYHRFGEVSQPVFPVRCSKNQFDFQVIYWETDSLFYDIKHPDMYKELAVKEQLRESLISPANSKNALYNIMETKWSTLVLDNMRGKVMEEFIGLKL